MIRRTDHCFLDIPYDRIEEVLIPSSLFKRCEGWGSFRMRHKDGFEVVFSDEMPGWQLWFENVTLDGPSQLRIVEEIAAHFGKATNQDFYVIQFERGGPSIAYDV